MPQSLSAVYIHLVFSTKERRPWLRDLVMREALHRELGGITNRLDCPPTRVGGVEDHVHILARLGRTISIADWVKEVKRVSSIWWKEEGGGDRDFQWQAGYGAFSVSASNLAQVREYIETQEEHHRKMTFQDEFRILMKKHDVEWDERYVWD